MNNRNLPGCERLAGLLADQMTKIKHGGLTLDELALFNQRKNPFEFQRFQRNEHGHIVLEFEGLDLTGEKEIERMEVAGFRLSGWAKSCLTSTRKDGYDAHHRLVAGQRYKVALMPTRAIERDSHRTTDALRKLGVEKYGYEKPLAGIVLRIREAVSDKVMEEMGFSYIAAPHDAITDSGGVPYVLSASRHDVGRWLRAGWAHPDDSWHGSGVFAFFDPKSQPADQAA